MMTIRKCTNMAASIVLGELVYLLSLSYIMATENRKNALLPDGHCSFLGLDTVQISQVHITFNKIFQIILFTIYLFYFCNFNKEIPQVHITFNKIVQIILFTIYLFYFYNFNKGTTTATLAAKEQNREFSW